MAPLRRKAIRLRDHPSAVLRSANANTSRLAEDFPTTACGLTGRVHRGGYAEIVLRLSVGADHDAPVVGVRQHVVANPRCHIGTQRRLQTHDSWPRPKATVSRRVG